MISFNIWGIGRALRIAVGIMALALLMVGGAGAMKLNMDYSDSTPYNLSGGIDAQDRSSLTMFNAVSETEIELAYDDGTAEGYWSLGSISNKTDWYNGGNKGHAVRFSSNSTYFTVNAIKIFGKRYGIDRRIRLEIWDQHKNILYQNVSNSSDYFTTTSQWALINVPAIDISGEFYVVLFTGSDGGNGTFIGFDKSSTINRSYVVSYNSLTWNLTTPQETTNWMLRAIGRANASSAPSISGVTITPTNPSASNEINITVAINNPGASFNGTVEGNIWLPSGTGKYLGWKNMVIPTGTSTVTIIGAAGGAKSSYITHEQGTYYYDVFLENVDKGEYYQTATGSKLSVPFTVGPAASVYMSNIVLSASPTNGSVMTLNVTISNPTASAFTGTMDANIWDSVRGYVLTPQSISITAGGSTTLTFSYIPVNHGLHSFDFFMVSDVSGQNTKAPWGFSCKDYVAGIGFNVV